MYVYRRSICSSWEISSEQNKLSRAFFPSFSKPTACAPNEHVLLVRRRHSIFRETSCISSRMIAERKSIVKEYCFDISRPSCNSWYCFSTKHVGNGPNIIQVHVYKYRFKFFLRLPSDHASPNNRTLLSILQHFKTPERLLNSFFRNRGWKSNFFAWQCNRISFDCARCLCVRDPAISPLIMDHRAWCTACTRY